MINKRGQGQVDAETAPKPRRHGKHSLNRKLTLIVVAAVSAAIVVIAGAALMQEARRHTQGKLDYLNATAAVFASATSQAVADGDTQAALLALRGVGRAPHLLYARVEASGGAILAEIGSGVSLDTDARFGDGSTASISLFEALRSHTIKVSQPIVNGGREVGRIRLVADNSDLMPSLMATLLQTLLGAIAALVVGAVIAARLQQWVVRPLLKLTDTVRHISQSHDYSARVDINSDDEVGELCGGFNIMIGEIKDRERRIIDLALHDAETDLPNRLAFERELAARISAPNRTSLAVAAIGVDRFQYMRGVIGYHLANDLLAELGARVCEIGAPARISTDVIAFIIDVADLDAVLGRGADIVAAAEEPMRLGVNDIDVTLTMGVALFGVHADAPQALIEHANIALDQARAAGAKVAVFDAAAYGDTALNLSLMADMMRALGNGEMTFYLQPKYDLRANCVNGAEVLVRWRHPTRGMVRPDIFVEMAEETGGIGPLTDWVLREAIACQQRMTEAGVDIKLAVNLSGRLLGDVQFVNATLPLLKQVRGKLFLEITETATMGDQERAIRHIEAMIAEGAHFSIDDYGSGLSSLAYLKRIPAEELKIDKAFIQTLGEAPRDALLVKSTIDLAHSLGMKVTAEGVETEEVFSALAAMGCDSVQGYWIGKPMPEADFIRFMATNGRQRELDSVHA